jgi:lambda family phage tail tape measure protein
MADLIEVTLAMDSEDVVKTLKNMEKLEKEIVRLQAGYTRLKQFQGTANLTQKQYAIGVAQTDAKIAHLTKTLHSGSAAINKHAEHLVQSKNKMSKFGMISQQVGYQVGDFFVQVQSGQSALVAFGQQGTQLAGLIPGIGGAIVGIGLAVGTMLVKGFMDASGASLKFSDATKNLTDSMDAYLSLSKDNADMTTKLKEVYGESTEQFVKLEERIQALSFRQMELDAIAAANAVKNFDFSGWKDGFGGLKTSFNTTNDSARTLQHLMEQVGIAGVEGPEAALEAVQRLGEKVVELGSKGKDIGGLGAEASAQAAKEQAEFLALILSLEKDLTRQIQIKKGLLTGTEQDNNKASDKAKEAIADANELLRLKREEAALEKIIIDQGEDSVDARAKNAENAALTAKAKWEEKFAADGISEAERDIINQLMEAAILHEKNKDLIADAKDEARELEKALREAATALGNMLTFGDGLDKSFAVVTAKVKALKAGMDATVAASTAGSLFDAGLKRDKAIEAGADPAEVNTEYQRQVELIGQINALLTEESNIKAALKAADKETPADKLTKEAFALDSKLNKQRAVMGLTGEQLYVEEMRYALIDKIGQEEAKNFTLEIDRVAKILAAKQQLIALDQQRADFADLVADSFADSFMSIVDGTATVKEAFRAMALDIVKHLFKVLVMQQAINAIGGAMSGSSNAIVKSIGGGLESYKAADGAAFSGGNVIPFASGGVVGSPTYFGMGGGQTGLMGEAGPEAIMPLKRGPDGKLGVATTSNSQSVTVVQNINVSTGVQQTVRAEVMGLMPQIAAASKAAVLDAKRRGGSFGGSFR